MKTHPSKTKFRKVFKPQPSKVVSYKCHRLDKGNIGLKVLAPTRITANQMEAVRRVIARETQRKAKVNFRTFPQSVVTKKPQEVRMGSGKGAPEFWVALVRPGVIMLEVIGVSNELAMPALEQAQKKLPVKTKIVVRTHGVL